MNPAPLSRSAHGRGALLDHPHIPEAYRAAADVVRAHLVHHRGGALFLSPADALLLVRWLDTGVEVAAILAAIERCAVSRRKNRARTRFTLTATRRHLHKPPLVPVRVEPVPDRHPYQPVIDALHASGAPDGPALGQALSLLRGDRPEEASALCAAHLERCWRALGAEEQARRIAEAKGELGDLAALVDARTLEELAEEQARHRFRQSWPRLDTATFQVLAGPVPA